MSPISEERIGRAVARALEAEARRLVPDDSDRESLETMDPADVVASMWDDGWARDVLAELLAELVERDR